MTFSKPLLQSLFFQEPAGRFALGQVLTSGSLDLNFEKNGHSADVGYWQCDLTRGNALTWSDQVYEIFGLPRGSTVPREDAVAKYLEHSRGVLEQMRTHAIKRKCGFMLDAAINPDGATRWIRILAAPIIEADRVVGLRGWKRILKPER